MTDDKVNQVALPGSGSESVWQRTWKVLVIFLPAPLKEAYKLGVLLVLIYVVISLVAFPLLVVFLSSFWLTFAKDSQIDLLRLAQSAYGAYVYRGFGFDDLVKKEAERQNARIDYVMPIDQTLDPADPKNLDAGVQNLKIRLEMGQLVKLRLTEVLVNPNPSRPCAFAPPSTKAEVLKITFVGKEMVSCIQTQNGDCSGSLDAAWWNQAGMAFQKGRDPVLTLEPTRAVQTACGVVHVEGWVAVYKDMAAMSASPAASSGR